MTVGELVAALLEMPQGDTVARPGDYLYSYYVSVEDVYHQSAHGEHEVVID